MVTEIIPRQLVFYDIQGTQHSAALDDIKTTRRPVVVLGEPGMGKTHLLKQLNDPATHVYVKARAFLRHPDPRALATDERTLVIDALDELSTAKDDDPVHQVLMQLGKAGYPPFVLSCRSADWSDAIARHDISEDYADAPWILHLLALTRDDALSFLAGRLGAPRAEGVLAHLETRGLERLYGNPMLLRLMADVVDKDGELPNGVGELYERSCEMLWQEHDEARPRSALSALTQQAALDAAGAACAAILLTGAETVSRQTHNKRSDLDLPLSEVSALPAATELLPLLGSKLFVRFDDADRFAPLHRTIAEYLGARWLAGLLDTQTGAMSKRRLLGLVRQAGGVPAALRGLHAWLAHFSPELAPDIVQADPYGVLRYAETSALSIGARRTLITALQRLSVEDPYFRSGDRAGQVVAALASRDLLPELKALLISRDTAFQLRMLLLEAIRGQPAVDDLAAELVGLVLADGKDRQAFAARRAAASALSDRPGLTINWPAHIALLAGRTGDDPRRLAVELIASIGPDRFDDRLIATSALSYLNLLPRTRVTTRRVDTIGPLHFLAKSLPDDRLEGILQALVALAPSQDRQREWQTRYAFSDFVDTLIARRLEAGAADPLHLLAWLRLLKTRDVGTRSQRQRVTELLRADTPLRRAIQHHALLVEADRGDLWTRFWTMTRSEPGLNPDDDDFITLLNTQPPFDPALPADVEKLCDLMRLVARWGGPSKAVRAAIAPFARSSPPLATLLKQIGKPQIHPWEKQEAARLRREARAQSMRWQRQREIYQRFEPDLRVGVFGRILEPARAYLGHYYDVAPELPPVERLVAWLGPDLAQAAFDGFEATLHRPDLPDIQAIVEIAAQSKVLLAVYPMLAGMVERVRRGQDFDGITDAVMLATRASITLGHIDSEPAKPLEAAVNVWFARRPDLAETYARKMIEPQMRLGAPHVSGLYPLMRQKDALVDLDALALEWLDAFPSLDRTAELELIGRLVRTGRWAALRQAGDRRAAAGYLDDDHRLTWLAIAFRTDFEARGAEIDAAAKADPKFLWALRENGGAARQDDQPEGAASLASLLWLVETFRPLFPYKAHPSGSWSGNDNAWDAADYLQAVIRRIGADLGDEALAGMTALRDAPADKYTPYIRSVWSEQKGARLEADFKLQSLETVASVLTGAPPTTVRDLQALTLDALETVQKQLKGDAYETVSMFHGANGPLDENGCRNRLAILLRGLLPGSVETIPERAAPGGTRADLAISLGALHLPIEAKGQWHKTLWSAAQAQLDEHYTRDHKATGVGLYMVFWFGPQAPDRAKLRGPPRGKRRPTTPEELQTALSDLVPAHRRGDIAVMVLDVSQVAKPSP